MSLTIGTLALLAALTAPGCRLSVEDASALIQPFVVESDGPLNLTELTTSPVWESLQGQVFQSRSSFRTWFVKDETVVEIGDGWGGPGVYDIVVADIHGSGTPQIIAAYGTGSGFTTYHVEVLELSDPPTRYGSGVNSLTPLYLRPATNGGVLVLTSRAGRSERSIVLGNLFLDTSLTEPIVALRTRSGLPRWVRRALLP